MEIKQFDYLLISEDFDIETKEGLQKEIRNYYYMVLFVDGNELIVMNINGLRHNLCVHQWTDAEKEYNIKVIRKEDVQKKNLYRKSKTKPLQSIYNVGIAYKYNGKEALEMFEPVYFNGREFVNFPSLANLDSKIIREHELKQGLKNR